MDPTANLTEQRKLAAEILALADSDDGTGRLTTTINTKIADKADRLAELVQALDEWIARGGFLPEQWRHT